ncbi:MAG: hypothetical protein HRU32_00600 [Rhodobacteraceae bacterium]|nr:hypothetical protein [Paracoccaceae bacterium]
MIAHFVLAGQSNIDQWFYVGDGAPLGAFRQTFLELNPEYTDVEFFDAARGGSAMLSASATQYAEKRAADDPALYDRIAENFWYDETSQSAGNNLDLFSDRLAAEVASGTEFLGVIWAQGEADTTYVGPETIGVYAEGLEFVLEALMDASGAPKVYIQALGDRSVYSETLHAGTGLIREAQQALAEASEAITVATTIFDRELRDTTHLTLEGYSSAASQMAVAISTEFVSPGVANAMLLSPTVVLVQLDLGVGQSASTLVGLGGFRLTDQGEDVTILSVDLTPAGLLRVETDNALVQPTLSYASAQDSIGMKADDYIVVASPFGETAALPFTVTLAEPRDAVFQIEAGVMIENGDLSQVVTGLSGDDLIYGNGGHDTIDGGWGTDTMFGGAGSDTFVLGADAALDVVMDFEIDRDAIGLRGFSQEAVSFAVGPEGDLVVLGPSGQTILLAGVSFDAANDLIVKMLGTDGDNTLNGQAGDDRIYGMAGDDTIDAGAGTDRIWLGDGFDTLAFGTGYGTNIVYDFDLGEDTITLTDQTAADLTFLRYKHDDLEIRTAEGDRLILRDVDLCLVDALEIIDAAPQVSFVTGSDAADILRGSGMDEVFEGRAGTDRIYTGGGNDVLVLREGSNLNIAYDFDIARDRIVIEAAAEEALKLLTYKETDAELRLASGDRLVLRNVDVDDLIENDLIGFDFSDFA